jgi:hypothetical protein
MEQTSLPYLDEVVEGQTFRGFSEFVDPIDLKWHRDQEDREVIATGETDWMIQLEDKLPQSLHSTVFIKRGQWHRLIKGTSNLELKIIKHQ